jgi:hypothetical protein
MASLLIDFGEHLKRLNEVFAHVDYTYTTKETGRMIRKGRDQYVDWLLFSSGYCGNYGHIFAYLEDIGEDHKNDTDKSTYLAKFKCKIRAMDMASMTKDCRTWLDKLHKCIRYVKLAATDQLIVRYL